MSSHPWLFHLLYFTLFAVFQQQPALAKQFLLNSGCLSKYVTGVNLISGTLVFPFTLVCSGHLSPFLTPLLLLFKSSDSSTRPYGMELAPGGIASLLLTQSVLFCARSGKSAGSWTPHLFHPEAQSLCPPAPPSLLAQSSQRGSRLALPAPPCPTIHQGCTTCKSLCQGPPQHSSSHQPGRGFLRTVSG